MSQTEVKDVDGELSELQNILASDSITSRTAGRNNNKRVRQHFDHYTLIYICVYKILGGIISR